MKINKTIPVENTILQKRIMTFALLPAQQIIAKYFECNILPQISKGTKVIKGKLKFASFPYRSANDAIITLIHALAHFVPGSSYARCLFIDYSSAFSTMQPHVLVNRLADYNIPIRLQRFVLDFFHH